MKKKCLLGWLKALESGKYKQSKGALRSSNGYCPLGILCDLSKLGTWKDEPDVDKMSYLKEVNYLPKSVATWAGISDDEIGILTAYMIVFNDGGKATFAEISKMLRAKYKIK